MNSTTAGLPASPMAECKAIPGAVGYALLCASLLVQAIPSPVMYELGARIAAVVIARCPSLLRPRCSASVRSTVRCRGLRSGASWLLPARATVIVIAATSSTSAASVLPLGATSSVGPAVVAVGLDEERRFAALWLELPPMNAPGHFDDEVGEIAFVDRLQDVHHVVHFEEGVAFAMFGDAALQALEVERPESKSSVQTPTDAALKEQSAAMVIVQYLPAQRHEQIVDVGELALLQSRQIQIVHELRRGLQHHAELVA